MDVDYSENSAIEKDETSQDIKSLVSNVNDERSEREVITNENTNTSVNNTNSNAAVDDFQKIEQLGTSELVAQTKHVESVPEFPQLTTTEDLHEKIEHIEAKTEKQEETNLQDTPRPLEQDTKPEQVEEPKQLEPVELKQELGHKEPNQLQEPAQSVDEISTKPSDDVEMTDAHEEQVPSQDDDHEQQAASMDSQVHPEESHQPSVLQEEVNEPASTVPQTALSEPEVSEKDDSATVPNVPVQDSNEGKADAEAVYDPSEPTDEYP